MDEPREPIFNAPWPAVAMTVAIIGGFGLQSFLPPEQFLPTYGFSPAHLDDGRAITLITALFVHGSWAHALMNAAGALAFGTPVARYYGAKATGALAFLLFYLVCGALANLGYGLVHAGDPHLLVGASGAVAGLMAAAARMIAGKGVPGPYLSPPRGGHDRRMGCGEPADRRGRLRPRRRGDAGGLGGASLWICRRPGAGDPLRLAITSGCSRLICQQS
ncbi:MAG: rhomboid family intramembrane serine protease [Phenylobacterium sp.]|uniref:rhomboid family intramembrane serine protease n=1 Tax=Phenylobacterium sp. TaxID=1871053 RepID=UPI001B67EF67|nr:rhomboid family intramembrane serine protease [Phenylobacterium sp.]MBP7648886.1 rhomboid family intramembrane serine protease [Phenylobacterium sp.]MBP7817521.1 rhomboid family intramembrane serine protease [Phenylobacterium sp.]MBP9231053.1 rhomboid family intramembrane serine protease [Phenylobacterium sp.]